jgi:hypothetical protein
LSLVTRHSPLLRAGNLQQLAKGQAEVVHGGSQ